jgi:hypothetical protein
LGPDLESRLSSILEARFDGALYRRPGGLHPGPYYTRPGNPHHLAAHGRELN